MNARYLLFLLLLLSQGVAAQKDEAVMAVHYTFSHMRDTAHPDVLFTENMVLLVGHEMNLYTNYDKLRNDSVVQSMAGKPGNVAEAMAISRSLPRVSQTEYFTFKTAPRRLNVKYRLLNDYLVNDTLPQISWTVLPDTMSILGVSCQKAVGKCKGRVYTAWFCPDIPVSSGPWKLNGLPGLILQATDAANQVSFKLANINYDTSRGYFTFRFPDKATVTTRQDFMKMQEAMRRDPAGFLANATDGKVKLTSTNMPANMPVRTVPNPLELEP